MSGADMLILVARPRKDLPLRVLADKHSRGTSPDNGLLMYFSASFHFEFRINPSRGCGASHAYAVFACNAAMINSIFKLKCVFSLIDRLIDQLVFALPLRAVEKEYVEGSISSA